MSDLFLGLTQHAAGGEPPRPVVLAHDERRRTHALVLGSPGSGKSKFLEWMIRSDIEARQGLCLVDLHGTLYEDVKRWCAYKAFRTRPIVLLDPSSGEYVKGFNPFRPKRGVAVDVQVGGMVQALLRVWGAENTNETPTLDRVLRLLFTAMVVREIPLHKAFGLINFDARDLRADVIGSFDEPVVRSAWQQIQGLKSRAEWRGEVLSTENRLFRLVSSPTIRRFMGIVTDDFNLDPLALMDQGAIVLVNLKESATLTEDNAKAFAALLLNDFFKAAIMFRENPRPFYFYLDEWQQVVSPDIEKILAQARKFGLLLVLANQALSQIRKAFGDDLVELLMTCCQMKACFGGLNRRDAQRMAEEMLVGQIDLNETKYVIEATKFWPRYGRDKVYSSGTARGTSSSSGSSRGTVSGATWNPSLEEWVPSEAASEGSFESEGSSESFQEGVADIPILVPEAFTEDVGRTVYTPDEQLLRWSDRLMDQYQRHCFLKLPGRPTVPLLVPRVPEYHVSRTTLSEYEGDNARQLRARVPAEVDAALEAGSERDSGRDAPRAPSTDEDFFE